MIHHFIILCAAGISSLTDSVDDTTKKNVDNSSITAQKAVNELRAIQFRLKELTAILRVRQLTKDESQELETLRVSFREKAQILSIQAKKRISKP